MEIVMVNASEAATAAGFGRSFDGGRASYLAEVNEAMQELAGVRYVGPRGVAESIHPGSEAWKDAYDRQVPARAFVEQTMRDFGFVRAGAAFSIDDAESYNSVKAAMCEFAAESTDWVRGHDGTLFNVQEDGVALMKPVRDRKSGRFGFGIEFREGAELDMGSRTLVRPGERTGTYAGFDIDQAMNKWTVAVRARADLREAQSTDFRF
jgi:hypothetical protein